MAKVKPGVGGGGEALLMDETAERILALDWDLTSRIAGPSVWLGRII